MKIRSITILLFLCFFSKINAQIDSVRVSIAIENKPITSVFKIIEEQTNYKFYYINDWFGKEVFSLAYKNVSVNQLLSEVLEKTEINFFIKDEESIFLTKNNIIYNTLPKEFFGAFKKDSFSKSTIVTEKNDGTPMFLRRNGINKNTVRTVVIGKESKGGLKKVAILSGIITNTLNGEPIPDLSLIVEQSNKGTTTNIDGFYSIELPVGEYNIKVQRLGFKSLRTKIILYGDGKFNCNLEEEVQALDEVILNESRNRNVEEAVTGIINVEIEAIKNIPLVLGERDILKVALTLPGVSNAGEGASGFNVRGGKADQNLVLLDDGVFYNPSHFFGIFSALNPYVTGSANLYKGSVPPEFGGRLSSVFDIKTKSSNITKLGVEAAIGPVTSNVVLEIPIIKEKSGLLIGARGTYSGWILRLLENDNIKNSKASFYDVVGKYNDAINENNEISTTGYFSRDAYSITSDSIFDYSNRLASFKWSHKFNNKNTGSLILSNSQYKFNLKFDSDSNTNFDLGYINNESELKLDFNYSHSKSHKFKYGLSSKLYKIEPGNVNPLGLDSEVAPLRIPSERAIESALYISDKYEVTDKLLIDAGVRFSFYAALGEGVQRIYEENLPRNSSTFLESREFKKNEVIETYGGPEFRISSRYFLTPNLSIKGSFNNTYQYIHALSNNTTASQTDTYKLSDLNIEPQQSNHYSLGLFKNLKEDEYELSLEGFYKRQKNLIDFKVGAQLLLNETVEAEVLQGDGKAYGVEFLIKKNTGRLNGWLGYSYSRSLIRLDSDFNQERVNRGEFFPSNFDRPHDFSVVSNYKFTKRFSASANFVYQTGRPATFPLGNFEFNNSEFVFFSDRNQFRIPDFYRLDLSFNVEGNHKIKKFAHSFWSLSIYNVLGRNNPFSVFFVTEDGDVKALQSSIFSVPIPTITYNFKF